MDWLEFVAAIVDALAWPVTVFFALFLVRKQLLALFPFLKRLKYKDFEVEFSEALQELSRKSKKALPPQPERPAQATLPGRSREELELLAEISPRSAILEAWLLVEAAAAGLIRQRGLASDLRYPGPMRIGQHLRVAEVLSSEQTEIFEQLRHLRNQAVHVSDAQFHTKQVDQYIHLALELASYLEQKAQEMPAPPE